MYQSFYFVHVWDKTRKIQISNKVLFNCHERSLSLKAFLRDSKSNKKLFTQVCFQNIIWVDMT